ncbi:unnamed protein product [Owenia fusiformis]|uniref:Uncharacterized protein n=1 Tax=Owenia fusiformis TaxID=6347 RepID=A0A8J1Y1Z0_OWEFU|nr:unnamed protein product [Owenia fusiformis]
MSLVQSIQIMLMMCLRHLLRKKRRAVFVMSFMSILGYFLVYKPWAHSRQIKVFAQGMGSMFVDQPKPEENQTCVHPHMNPFDPSIYQFYQKETPLKCTGEPNWIRVYNGTVLFEDSAIEKYGEIACSLWPLVRENDFKTVLGAPEMKIKSGYQLKSDFFKIYCESSDGAKYVNFHSGISYNANVFQRVTKLRQSNPKLDILMFGFDSVSRMSWIRNLPKSHKYFTEVLNGISLEGYNIVGDGTAQALLPILTGKTETELPEARRGKSGAKTVDYHPWIWNEYSEKGYVTQWGEDVSSTGTFQFRMLGFRNPPVDHYYRTFEILVSNEGSPAFCLGSLPRHRNMMNWISDMYSMYRDFPKFMFLFHNEFSHESVNALQKADDDLYTWLKHIHKNGYLDNALLILMSDHGARFQDIRKSIQGKLEERMPFFGLRFPEWFEKRYSNEIKNLQINRHRLSTPFDIHETFEQLLDMSKHKEFTTSDRGISLFHEIPKTRSCQDADIEPHWCACLNWVTASNKDPDVVKAAGHIVNKINNITEQQRSECNKLYLRRIVNAVMLKLNDNVLKFKKSADYDGRIPDFSDDLTSGHILYQVTIVTMPGDGHFESTIMHSKYDDSFKMNEGAISRINKYGNDPHCVMTKLPYLRRFCHCKLQK